MTPGAQPSQIPAQRSFKKSRRGCKTCKTRKVKCDESRPLCGNCSRRFPGLEKCDFEEFIAVAAKSLVPLLSKKGVNRQFLPSPQHSISVQPDGMNNGVSRVLELRLMHHYTTFTCSQLPDGESLRPKYCWSLDIPRLAFSSDLVLSALLGISALHHSALNPDDSQLFYAAGHYFARAVRNHRLALGSVDKNSAECLLATAILITHYTWVSAHTSQASAQYELPLQTYYMARGIYTLFQQMWPWLSGSGYLWYVDSVPVIEDKEITYAGIFLQSSHEDLATLSDTFRKLQVVPEDMAVYEEVGRALSLMYRAICEGAPQVILQRHVATMPLRLPERFLDMLKHKDPGALVLLARNLCLLKVIEPVWWLHGAGPSQQVAENAISGISKMLPGEWLWAMEWPLRVLTGKLMLHVNSAPPLETVLAV